MKLCNVCLFIVILLSCSCCQSRQKNLYIDTDYTSGNTDAEGTEPTVNILEDRKEIVVPFNEAGGVKSVAVKVNGIGLDMLFDTGCSSTLISVAEANYLYQKGLLKEEDILGEVQSMIADGSMVNNALINLQELIIADKIVCHNVRATVSANASAPLLLGNEVLDRAASYTIDNTNKVIIFKLK